MTRAVKPHCSIIFLVPRSPIHISRPTCATRPSVRTVHSGLLGRGSLWPSRVAAAAAASRGTFSAQAPHRLRDCLTVPARDRHTSQTRSFSSSSTRMVATKIDGTAIAKAIRERLHAQIHETQKLNPRFKPSLKILQVG